MKIKKLYRRLFIYFDALAEQDGYDPEPRPAYFVYKKKKCFKKIKLQYDNIIWLGPIEKFYYKEKNTAVIKMENYLK